MAAGQDIFTGFALDDCDPEVDVGRVRELVWKV